ncbi:MAG: hypothetical protein J3K34DRAFT_468666 [Monoraphidium minutum]|nr:MAG: hypothetical protein J3K34DRAFT_468666 [Monoraphidium minutum]
MARPALLRVAHRSAHGTADVDQPGSGGGGGSNAQKPAGTGGGGDGDDGARAPGPHSWAGPWAPAVAMGVAATPLTVGAYAILAAYEKVTHARARTDDLAKLEGKLDKLRDVMEASRLEARDLMEASRREVQAGQQELRCLMLGLEGRLQGRLGRLEAAAAVLGAGLLAAWAGRKPGAAGRGAA